jgi:hypothetical protein
MSKNRSNLEPDESTILNNWATSNLPSNSLRETLPIEKDAFIIQECSAKSNIPLELLGLELSLRKGVLPS